MGRISELSTITDTTQIPNTSTMFATLKSDLQELVELAGVIVKKCTEPEAKNSHQGLANYLCDRIQTFNKLIWFLESSQQK